MQSCQIVYFVRRRYEKLSAVVTILIFFRSVRSQIVARTFHMITLCLSRAAIQHLHAVAAGSFRVYVPCAEELSIASNSPKKKNGKGIMHDDIFRLGPSVFGVYRIASRPEELRCTRRIKLN